MSEIDRGPNESPDLCCGLDFWSDRTTGRTWLCNTKLTGLFQVSDNSAIRLFSTSKPTPRTYRSSVHAYYGGAWLILPDISQDRIEILPELRRWIEQQIAQGRPHIGVYIIG